MQSPFRIADLPSWSKHLHSHRRPLLLHLNADTTWLLQIPYPTDIDPPPGRSHLNVLIDPWLAGPQSDVAWWFSTQWHVAASSVASIAELNRVLGAVEAMGVGADASRAGAQGGNGDDRWFIDLVTVSHEFTDHCHRATLEELPPSTPVFATDLAADLIRSWGHFDAVVTTPALTPGVPWTRLTVGSLPSWLAVGRVVSPGNALYYHSAILVAFDLSPRPTGSRLSSSAETPAPSGKGARKAEALVYSPHGIQPSDLAPLPESGIQPLALLHGLHDVQIRYTKQLNLGALNGIRAVEASGARYWIATHDEVKRGGGVIAPMLWRKAYTLRDAVESVGDGLRGEGKDVDYEFRDLASGEGVVLL